MKKGDVFEFSSHNEFFISGKRTMVKGNKKYVGQFVVTRATEEMIWAQKILKTGMLSTWQISFTPIMNTDLEVVGRVETL